ncbi:MAG: DUF962 domain-containing protein [Hyphomonadaceae bacterium]|nr:DUF962 domain-containing protein [Hyphomonadaceae bacterium]
MSDTTNRNDKFQSFEEFYPFYLGEHADPKCRQMHYMGTSLTFVMLGLGIFVHPLWLLAIPFAGYGFAWPAHFFVEKNKPATFTYPLWSLIGDYKMFFSWLTGKLPAQLKAAGIN